MNSYNTGEVYADADENCYLVLDNNSGEPIMVNGSMITVNYEDLKGLKLVKVCDYYLYKDGKKYIYTKKGMVTVDVETCEVTVLSYEDFGNLNVDQKTEAAA